MNPQKAGDISLNILHTTRVSESMLVSWKVIESVLPEHRTATFEDESWLECLYKQHFSDMKIKAIICTYDGEEDLGEGRGVES